MKKKKKNRENYKFKTVNIIVVKHQLNNMLIFYPTFLNLVLFHT